MRIRKLRIVNFKCFADTKEIELDAGFNLIVGINNAGKSAFLKAASLRFEDSPHRSIRILPNSRDQVKPESSIEVEAELSGEEMARGLKQRGTYFHLPIPTEISKDFQGLATGYLANLLTSDAIPVSVRVKAMSASPRVNAIGTHAIRAYQPFIDGQGTMHFMQFVSESMKFRKQVTSDPAADSTSAVVESLLQTIYRFDAERLHIRAAPTGDNPLLEPNASNLAQVLHRMQQGRFRFNRYIDLVREVFPAISSVAVRPSANAPNMVEVAIWKEDEKTEREDLALPLIDCGTGIGQVLAILYVLVTAENPITICIDEPNSFLHPGASRALVRILKRHPQHQYLIATHAPEVISELSGARLIRIVQDGPEAKLEQFARGSMESLRDTLTSLGARMADVLGFERVIWVEGPSDADTFSLLSSRWFPEDSATMVFLGVKHTSDFDASAAPNALHVYERLVSLNSPMPPHTGFLFDREGRTEAQISDLEKRSKGLMKFLSRRMLENFLLHPEGIAELLRSLGPEETLITSEEVAAWIRANGGDSKYKARGAEILSTKWLSKVDGAKLLADLVPRLTGERHSYDKVNHAPALAQAIINNRIGDLDELKGCIAAAIGR